MAGAKARTVGNGYRFTGCSLAGRSPMGTLQREALGFATVATTRRPFTLAATDMYCYRPKLTRRELFRSTSSAHSQGPDSSSAGETYSKVCVSIGAGYATFGHRGSGVQAVLPREGYATSPSRALRYSSAHSRSTCHP